MDRRLGQRSGVAALLAGLVLACGCGSDAPPPTSGGSTNNPPPSNTPVVFTTDTVRVARGATTPLPLDNLAGLNFTSSDQSIAIVSSSGIITGTKAGVAKLTASSASSSGSVIVRVIDSLPLRGFRSPLADSAPMGNVFDHDLPFEFSDNNGYLLSFWGEKVGGIDGHNGYDFLVPVGTPVLAAGDGQVISAGNEAPFSCPLLGNATVSGLWVEIAHPTMSNGDVVVTQYGHFSRIDVAAGQSVTTGQRIGLSGSTGCSSAPHLHFSAYNHVPGSPNGAALVMDPFGWAGNGVDVYANYKAGTVSVPIWAGGAAPPLYVQLDIPAALLPNVPVAITTVRPAGVDDAHNPNNEMVALSVLPNFSDNQPIANYTLTTLAGVTYKFPSNAVVTRAHRVRLFSGSGAGNDTTYYWGQSKGVIQNTVECLTLRNASNVIVSQIGWGTTCGSATIAGALSSAVTARSSSMTAIDARSPFATNRVILPSAPRTPR